MIKVGLLGCGNVGQVIVKEHVNVEIVALYDSEISQAEKLAATTGSRAYKNFDEFIRQDFDIVVEAASVEAVKMYAEEILKQGKNVVILSVGALADEKLRKRLEKSALEAGKKVYIPSGAILGLDNLKIGQISGISHLMLRTTKNPKSLGIETDHKMMIFKGRAFPKNINVAVALELATEHEAEVELWVDPDIDRNMHEVFVKGEFGDFYIKVNNNPCPDNPATSYLAALSIVTLLKNLDRPIVVGT